MKIKLSSVYLDDQLILVRELRHSREKVWQALTPSASAPVGAL
jgi:hypothetical protein